MFNSHDFKSTMQYSKGVYVEFCRSIETVPDKEFQDDIKLAVCEALANCIEHGNHCNPKKKVHMAYSIQDTAVRIIMRDEGDGFDLEQKLSEVHQVNDEHGRGLLLIYDMMDRVKFLGNGNGIYMYKKRG